MKEFFAAHTVEVGIIIATITAIGVFVGPWFASWRQRKYTEQDRKLSTHFAELRKETGPIMSFARGLGYDYGRIASTESVMLASSESAKLVDSKEVQAPEISARLEAHFLGRSEKWKGLIQRISEHNTNYKAFCQKIETDFEKKGIPVEKDLRKDSCCIYEDAFDALFNMWRELARNKPGRPDFQKINSEQADGGYFLRAQNWASALAFAKTEDDKRKYRLALADIADDIGNQNEATKIVAWAEELVEKAREFESQLAAKLDETDKYWPGTQTNRFRRLEKTCPECKKLFSIACRKYLRSWSSARGR